MSYAGSPTQRLAASRAYTKRRGESDPAWATLRKADKARRADLHRLALRIIVHQVKSIPCADCGNRYDVECMDLDHREGEEKVANVSRMVATGLHSEATVLAEIAKCDVVCSNCHRLRTKRRREPLG